MQCSFVENVRIFLRVCMLNVTVLPVSNVLFIQKKMRFNLVFTQKKMVGSLWNKRSLRLDGQGDWDSFLHRESRSHVALGRDIFDKEKIESWKVINFEADQAKGLEF